MSAHLSNEIVERFHSQSLIGGDRSVIYDHILSCDTCRRKVVTSQTSALALQALTNHILPQDGVEPYHLDQATIDSFVNDTLDPLDRSTVKLHLEDCAECSDEVNDFRESLATMKAASRLRQHGRATIATPTSRPMFSFPMKIAAAVILIAVATVALIVLSRLRSTPVESVGSQPSPLSSPQPPGVAPSPAIINPPQLAENPPVKGPIEKEQSVIAVLKDGANKIALDQSGNVVGLPALPSESRQAVKEALSGQAINRPEVLDEVTSAQVSERASSGNEERIRIAYPTNSVILGNRPTLRWSPSKTAKSYRIEIADNAFHQIAKSEDLPASSSAWTPATQLKRGGIYTWSIRAVNKDGEASALTSQGKFKVLGEDEVRKLNRLKASKSHLGLGLLYAHEGMISEAEREFRALVNQNPDSAVAKRLLKDVRSWR